MALRSTDLMIGDWVLYPYQENEIRPGKIVYISESGSVGIVFDNGMEVATNLCYCKSVILTPEILEKNGFYIPEDCLWYRHPKVDFLVAFRTSGAYLYADELHDRREHFCVIHYVHELQHALMLCGIDKEIIL